MQLGITIEDEMRTKMIQAVEIEPGRWGKIIVSLFYFVPLDSIP